jgi:hypothetical protein
MKITSDNNECLKQKGLAKSRANTMRVRIQAPNDLSLASAIKLVAFADFECVLDYDRTT